MIYRGKTIIAVPPGETIVEIMDDRKISREELAEKIDISAAQLNLLLEGVVPVSPGIASKLEKLFGIPAYFWLNLEAIYREDIATIVKEKQTNSSVQPPAIFGD
ncbi:MAG: helix-turn-helix domain-containing protein [Clostridia bacterium]|nr:helix-turn-helix domain-containing protein [Clostridia bacterium]